MRNSRRGDLDLPQAFMKPLLPIQPRPPRDGRASRSPGRCFTGSPPCKATGAPCSAAFSSARRTPAAVSAAVKARAAKSTTSIFDYRFRCRSLSSIPSVYLQDIIHDVKSQVRSAAAPFRRPYDRLADCLEGARRAEAYGFDSVVGARSSGFQTARRRRRR